MSSDQTDITCAEVEDLLPLIADGVLGADDEPAAFEHLQRCESCASSLAAHDLIQLALERQPPREPVTRIHHITLPWPSILAAAAVLAIAFGGWLALHQPVASEAPSLAINEQDLPRTRLISIEEAADGSPRYILLQETSEGFRTITVSSDAIDGGNGMIDRGALVPIGLTNER